MRRTKIHNQTKYGFCANLMFMTVHMYIKCTINYLLYTTTTTTANTTVLYILCVYTYTPLCIAATFKKKKKKNTTHSEFRFSITNQVKSEDRSQVYENTISLKRKLNKINIL